jgi:tetratricopeptide (TPR) repeat protein
LAEATDADGLVLGKVLNGAGMLSWCCGDYDKSHAFHERNLALRRELGDQRGIARALGNLCIVFCCQEEWKAAEACGQESLDGYRSLRDEMNSVRMLNSLGVVATRQQDYLRAENLYREALSVQRAIGDASGSADVLHNLGELFLIQSLYDRAKPYFRESLLAQRTLGNKQQIASTLTHLAATAGAEGDDARACLLWGAAEHILQAGGITAFEEIRQYQVTLENSRATLGEEQFQIAWSQGYQMDAAQIISFVLQNYAELSQ